MGKTSPTVQTTSNSTQTVPAYASEAQQNLLGAGYGMLGGYLGLQPNQRVAGVNADQSQAYDLARQVAQGAFQTQAPSLTPATSTYTPQGYTPQGYAMTPTQAKGYDATGYAATGYDAVGYDPRMGTAQQIDGQGIRDLLSPYTQDVVDVTNANLRRQYGQTAAGLGAQAAAAGSFGGSRAALQAAQLDRSFGEQVASNTASQMASGWDKAAQLASTNTSLRQQTELANQSAANTAAQFLASAKNSAAQFGAGATNTANQFSAGAQNTANQFGAGAYNTAQAADAANATAASRYGADTANTAAQFLANAQNTAGQFNTNFNAQQIQQIATLRDALTGNDYNRKMQAVALLRQIGGDQQQLLQNILNVPTQALAQYASIVPSNYGGTTNTVGTAPNPNPDLGTQLLGGALGIGGRLISNPASIAALGGLFCDARLKKDISPVAVEPNGRILWSFRYAWEDEDTEPTIGPMAQLEAIRDPGSVVTLFGVQYLTRH